MKQIEGYGPWIIHDGQRPKLRTGDQVRLQFMGRKLIVPDPADFIGQSWPGFFWEMKRRRSRWTRKVRFVRECYEPEYEPVIAYCIKQQAQEIDRLRKLALDTSAPITGPEVAPRPLTIKEAVKIAKNKQRRTNPWENQK